MSSDFPCFKKYPMFEAERTVNLPLRVRNHFEIEAGRAISRHVIDTDLMDGCLIAYTWLHEGDPLPPLTEKRAMPSPEKRVRDCWEETFEWARFTPIPITAVEIRGYTPDYRTTPNTWKLLPADLFAEFSHRFFEATDLHLKEHRMSDFDEDELLVTVSHRDYWLKYGGGFDENEKLQRKMNAAAVKSMAEATEALQYPPLTVSKICLYDDGNDDLLDIF